MDAAPALGGPPSSSLSPPPSPSPSLSSPSLSSPLPPTESESTFAASIECTSTDIDPTANDAETKLSLSIPQPPLSPPSSSSSTTVPPVPPDAAHELPLLVPPYRFALIVPGIYRGAYPVLRNLRFLLRLGLRCLLSLTPEPPSKDLVDWCQGVGVRLHHFRMTQAATPGPRELAQCTAAVQVSHLHYIYNLKLLQLFFFLCYYDFIVLTLLTLSSPSSLSSLSLSSLSLLSLPPLFLLSIYQLLLSPSTGPVYVHCVDGRRGVGLLALLLRRLQGWPALDALAEYWR